MKHASRKRALTSRLARFTGLLWVALVSWPSLACCQAEPSLLARGRQLFFERNLAQAETVTRQALAADPKSAAATYLLGHILEAEKKPTESLEAFTHAAAFATPTGEDLRVVAMDYVLLNAYPEALRWLTRSVQLDPDNAEAWYDLGRAMMMQGDLHGARLPLERSLALIPGQTKVIDNLGVVAEGEDDPERAAALYRQAIALGARELNPSEQPYLNLGSLLLQQGKPAQALPLLMKAVHQAPHDAKCHEMLARAEEQQDQRPAAIEQLELAVALEPGSAALHYQLGQLYRRAGFPDKAKVQLELSGSLYGTHSSSSDH